MASHREPQLIAKRALILGAISFRASLEATDHPRVIELTNRLLPWLIEIGCDDELDQIERELLSTPRGDLSESQKTDANWAGETAMFFSWMLKLLGPLDKTNASDASALATVLPILYPDAEARIRSATLRDRAEIRSVCEQFAMIRFLLQEERIDPANRATLRRVNLQDLAELGVVPAEDAIRCAAEAIARMSPDERGRAAGLYFVRSHAAMWYLSSRSSYFA